MYVFFHFVLRRIDLQCWERMRFLFCSRCWKIFEFLDKLSKNICIFKRKKRGFWMIFIGMEWVDCCCCGVGWFEKNEKNVKKRVFLKREVKSSATWREFFMGTWTHSFFCQVIFRYFPVVILRFFAFAVFFGGVAFRFFHACDFVFFCDFRQFWTFRFSAPRAVAIASLELLKRAWIELFNGSKLVINCADGVE